MHVTRRGRARSFLLKIKKTCTCTGSIFGTLWISITLFQYTHNQTLFGYMGTVKMHWIQY